MSLLLFSVQILANLVMETLHSDLRDLIGPRLKGKMQQKQRSWMLVSSSWLPQSQGCPDPVLEVQSAVGFPSYQLDNTVTWDPERGPWGLDSKQWQNKDKSNVTEWFSLQISDAVYRQVLCHTTGQYNELVESCEVQRVPLDARLRTDMDQIVTSKEHVTNKIRGRK